jgi:ribosome biogenesis protein BMS1
MKKIKLIG